MSEQKKKHDYSPIVVLESFAKGLANEGDRATVILVAAKLDLLLYQILRKHLIPAPGSRDDLLDNDGALSTFSAKINMAYRLGLIDNLFSRSLHLIRKIRNDFAHEVEGCSLNSGSHRDRVRELIALARNLEFFKKSCGILEEGDKFTLISIQFRIMVGLVCLDLENLYEECNILVGKDALDLLHTVKINISKTISETDKS